MQLQQSSSSDCKVSVIVNGIMPYQRAFPNGQDGQNGYSAWNYTLTPAYTNIKVGQNKITSKFPCSNDPNLISHNSVNVTDVEATRVAANDSSPVRQISSVQGVPLNSTSLNTNESNLVPLY
jgi:hypothetical protein